MGRPQDKIPNQRCRGTTRTGRTCTQWAMLGGTVCRMHGGRAPQVAAKAAVRAEVLRWQVGTAHADPGEVLLRLVTQSWARVDQLAARLEQLVAEHSGDLAAAMVGDTLMPDPNGGTIKVGEYVRGLAQLEAQERERCAGWSAKAIAAGLNKRMVELAEGQGRLIAELLRAVLADEELGLTVEQRRAIPDVARRHLALVV